MCFGGGQKQQAQPDLPPVPAPTPIPTAADPNPIASAEQKRRRIDALKYGAMSTIKTSGAGITGTGPNLNMPYATGQKQTLGA